jgi:chromosome partitioning protein
MNSVKGGVGKTSLTALLAARLAATGYRVCVVDADPNACFAQWHELYDGPEIKCIAEPRNPEVVDELQKYADDDEYDVVFCDTAGFANTTAAMAAATADYVLIPVMPDRFSAEEGRRTFKIVEGFSRAGRNRTIPAHFVRTRWNPRLLVERAVTAELEGDSLPMLNQHISSLTDVGKLSLSGELPAGAKIIEEVDALICELIEVGAVPSIFTGPFRRSAERLAEAKAATAAALERLRPPVKEG